MLVSVHRFPLSLPLFLSDQQSMKVAIKDRDQDKGKGLPGRHLDCFPLPVPSDPWP